MRYNSVISYILIFLNILTAGVHFEIQDVDTAAGSLNIYMNNEIGCEIPYFEDQTSCEAAQFNWYDGEISGFQIELDGITITGASGGLAEDNGFSVYTCFKDLIDSIVIFLCSLGGVKFKIVSISGLSNISSNEFAKEIEYLEL